MKISSRNFKDFSATTALFQIRYDTLANKGLWVPSSIRHEDNLLRDLFKFEELNIEKFKLLLISLCLTDP